jgi:undecaprenyl-diphosphatase
MTRVEPLGALAFLLAFALALGRPYLGMHYPSDVLAGAVLGIALGLLVPLSL